MNVGAVGPETVLQRAPSCVLVPIEDEAVLVSEPTGRVQILAAPGVRAWNAVDGMQTVAAICRDLARWSATPYEAVLDGVRRMLAELLDAGMLEVVGESSGPPRAADHDAESTPGSGDLSDSPAARGRDAAEAAPPAGRAGCTVQVADRLVEVSANDTRVLALLCDAFGSRAREPMEPDDTISLLIGPDRGELLTIHSVVRGSEQVFRSADLGRALRMLLGELASMRDASPTTTVVVVARSSPTSVPCWSSRTGPRSSTSRSAGSPASVGTRSTRLPSSTPSSSSSSCPRSIAR